MSLFNFHAATAECECRRGSVRRSACCLAVAHKGPAPSITPHTGRHVSQGGGVSTRPRQPGDAHSLSEATPVQL
jgi:hypothetical protein